MDVTERSALPRVKGVGPEQQDALPVGWQACLLGEALIRVVGGGTPSRAISRYWQGEIAWASVKDFQDDTRLLEQTEEQISADGLIYSAANLIEPGTLLLCTRMAVGRAALTTQPTAINQDVKALYPKSHLSPAYLRYLLTFHRQWLETCSIGSTVKGLSLERLLALPLQLPPLSEQQRIVTVLDSADICIKTSERLIAQLKQVRKALVDELLTCGIDGHGRVRDPLAHPELFQESAVGRIPREWTVVPLGSLIQSITSGSRGWAVYYAPEGALFLRIGNLTREHVHLRFNEVIHVRPPAGAEGTRTRVQAGDVLISITADLGITGVIPADLEEAYINQHIALLRFNGDVDPYYVANYLAGKNVQKQVYLLNDIGAKAGLNLPTVARLLIALPARHQEQTAIATMINAHDVRIASEEAHVSKLRQASRALLHDLLSGRMRV